MQKILSVYVNLQDERLNLPSYLEHSPFIISICPASIKGNRFSNEGIGEVSRLLDNGCILGQRGYIGRCRYPHDDGTDPWHENFCLYNNPLGLERQLELMSDGQKILADTFGIDPLVYAPINHLFDEETIAAAQVLKYESMMDQNNFGVMPYDRHTLRIIPEAKIGDKEVEESMAVYCHVAALRERKVSRIIKQAELVLPESIAPQNVSNDLLVINEIRKRVRKYERDLDSLKKRP